MAQSQDPPPQTPQIPTEQQPNGAAKGQSQSGQQTPSSEQVSPASQQHTSDNAERQADGDSHKRAEETREYWPFLIFGARLKITDSLLALFTFMLIVVGGMQGFFLYRTDQGTHKAANAAKESADAARDAVKVSSSAQRAWVAVEAIKTVARAEPDTGKVLGYAVSVVWTNVGQTPATNLALGLSWRFYDPEEKVTFETAEADKVKAAGIVSLGPKSTMESTTVYWEIEEIKKIMSGKQRFFLFAFGYYNDVIIPTETRFTQHAVEVRFVRDPAEIVRSEQDFKRPIIGLTPFHEYNHMR